MPKPAIKQDRYQMTVAVLPDVMSELLFLQAFYAQARNRPISLNDTVIQALHDASTVRRGDKVAA